jgi:Flp pilus assembly protein TadD
MTAEAKRVLRRLAEQNPGDAPSQHLYSVALYELGEREAGIEVCRRVLKLDPKFVPALHNMAVACMLDGQWSKARYWVHQALLVEPDDGALRRLRLKLRLHALAEVSSWAMGPVRLLWPSRRRRIDA